MDAPRQRLCVVTPCFNEAEVIGPFYSELKAVLQSLADLEHQILFIDDGSTDGTLDQLNALAARDPAVRVYALSRNFGHQIALTAGLDAADADAVVMMDSDLQHPPSLIPEMVRLWRQGNDVVSAVRRTTADASPLKSLSSSLFYGLVNRLSDTRIVPGAADFCLLSRRAHAALCQLPERHRFLRGMVSWIGYPRTFVEFTAPPRAAGQSKYTLARMMKLALNATFSFSIVPLRLAAQLGLLAVFLSLVHLVFILIAWFRETLVPGWATIVFLVTFLGGVQLVFIGVLGEYLARIFEEVKQRPLYLLKQSPTDPPRPGSSREPNA
ncbi:MAG: glycosyltransferase family 2 protein [Verrucomicrobiota bacterium]